MKTILISLFTTSSIILFSQTPYATINIGGVVNSDSLMKPILGVVSGPDGVDTTINPNLGVATYDNKEITLADIPGLIEGAHTGVGLGIKFLKHIERCKALLHMIDITEKDLNYSYDQVKKEMANYSKDLLNKKEIIVLNKVDLLEKKKVNEIIKSFSKNKNCEVLVLSTLEKNSI